MTGREFLVADGDVESAAVSLRLLSDPILVQYLSLERRGYTERHYIWKASARWLSDVYQHVLFQTAARSQKTRYKTFAAGLAR
jgi:hypothetical protein